MKITEKIEKINSTPTSTEQKEIDDSESISIKVENFALKKQNADLLQKIAQLENRNKEETK